MRRLAVFVGGWRFVEAEPVCQAAGALDLEVLEGLASLLDKSLLRQEPGSDGEPRFGMLSVLREFGLEQLEGAGELAATRAAHAACLSGVGQGGRAASAGRRPKSLAGPAGGRTRQPARRAALGLEQAEGREGSAAEAREGWELAGRVAGALIWFWLIQGHHQDSQRFLMQVVEAPRDVAGEVRAKVLLQASWAALTVGTRRGGPSCWRSPSGCTGAWCSEFPEGVQLQRGLLAALTMAGHMALNAGEYAALERLCEESLALCRQVGERWREAEALHLLALGHARRGEEARGRALCEAVWRSAGRFGKWGGTSVLLLSLGCFAWRQGDPAGAQRYMEESLAASQQSAMPVLIAPCLIWLGIILVTRGQPSSAARLWGTAERVGGPPGGDGAAVL